MRREESFELSPDEVSAEIGPGNFRTFEHHVSHLPIPASTELERVVNESESVPARMLSVSVDPDPHALPLVLSPSEIHGVKVISPASLALSYTGNHPRRLQVVVTFHDDPQSAI